MFRIRLKPKKSKQKEGEREIVSSDKVWDDSKENNDEAINRIEYLAKTVDR